MNEIRVESWVDLQEALFAGSWRPELGRHRSNYAFRGRTSADETLETSLLRLGGDARSLEGYLLRNFRKYARRGDVPTDSVWDWLALGQHHGLPTRLLDWTYSPFVALHFATANLAAYDRDGVVWAIDYTRVHEQLPDALRDVLDHEGANVFTPELLARAARTFRDLERIADEPFCTFLEPPSLDERIVNQYALFSLLSDSRTSLDEWLAGREDVIRKIVVPAGLKWEVRDKLDQANITERVLFPGLDGLSAWLTRYYRPRPDS
jgi:FRG domain